MFGELGKVTVNKPIIICADNVVAGYVMSGALSGISSVRKDISIRIISSESPCETSEYDVLISVAPSPKTIDFEGETKLVGVMDAVNIGWCTYIQFFCRMGQVLWFLDTGSCP